MKLWMDQYLLTIFYLLFAVGIFGHMSGALRPLMRKLSESFLLIVQLSSGLFLFLHQPGATFWWVLLIIFTASMLLEILGVKTGKIFGRYHYTKLYKIQILSVPVVIAGNWILLSLGAWGLSSLLLDALWQKIVYTAIMVVMSDTLIEPVAIRLRYWKWEKARIPKKNYITWLVFAIAIAALLSQVVQVDHFPSRFFAQVFLLNIVFFACIRAYLYDVSGGEHA